MLESSDVESFLSQAKEREKAYDWLGAAEFYEKAIGLVPETDFLKLGQLQERMGYAFYRAALQAESVGEFGERMRRAVADYERAKEFYSRLSESGKKPLVLRCDAMIAYMGYWLTSDVSEKKRLLDECWKITKEVLRAFKEVGDALEYGKTYNQLWLSVWFGSDFEESFQVRENITRETVEYGEQAIKFLSTCGDSHELARAYVSTATFVELFGLVFHDPDEQDEYLQKAKDYWQKANELSEEVAFCESCLGHAALGLGLGTNEALKYYEKALEYARKTRDRLRIGLALDMLDHHTVWSRYSAEDPTENVRLLNRALEYAEEAKRQYSTISLVIFSGAPLWVEAPHAEYYYLRAELETDLSKRRELLEKAMEAIPDLLRRAEKSGISYAVNHAHHVVSKILTSQATVETDSEERKRLLEKALEHRNESIRYFEQQRPFAYWVRGLMRMYLARIKSELAKLAKGIESEKNVLQQAAADQENGLKLCSQHLASQERQGIISTTLSALSDWQREYGNLLKRLYGITRNGEYLTKAIEAFEGSAESARKLDLASRVAESNWKIAQTYDALGKHLKAAESFDLASNNYKTAAEKIPQLKALYQDLSLYMQAWSEIEKARYHHAKQEYGVAEEHFDKAADLHKSLKQRNYLALNYSAWAQVEHAEELSRKEQGEEAIRAFEQAAKLFNETRKALQTKFSEIEDLDEKQMVTNMLKATSPRLQYCTARATLEEAKLLDKKGDHYTSSEKYGSAAEAFEKIIQALESEQEQKEIKFIVNLSRAWQKMTLAEAEASPTLYGEASQLFEGAKEFGPNEQAKMLALGHSRFCRALEAGTTFADTGDAGMYTAAVQYLESAAKYYANAGLQKASEYAEATELLFDAYVHMDKAKRESDPEKKTKLYMMAEKVLQTSAGSFMKAEHPEKREQVLRLLERVKKERELAISLAELLHAPSIVSTTTALPTPTPTHETAVGSERFENADIQANIITRQRELRVGENLYLEIELVNAGKGPALLIKLTEVIPEGFELAERPEIYRVEDSYLNMKGKRLDPLKTEEVRLVLKPKAQGVFPLKPIILYLDEYGKYKSYEPEPVTITVKELGVRGWIKGER